MHDAYEPLTILEKFPLQIETITSYDGNLVVGTKQGHLLMYSITSDSTTRMKINLLRSNKNFSRKPITQIVVVPEHQILISLSDQILSVHDMTVFNFPLMSTLQKTKGASAFDLDVKHHTSMTGEDVVTVRLVVAVRRKLQFYYWKARQFHELTEDMSLLDSPRSLMWCGESVAVAFKYDYVMVKLSGGQHDLFDTGKSQQPLLTRVSDSRIALQRDEKTICINAEGSSSPSMPNIEWQTQPLALAFDELYVIALLPKSVHIQSQNPKLHVQTLDLEKAKYLTTNVTSKNKKQVFVASATHIWCLCSVAVSNQIPQLLSSKQFELALKLADLWDECSNSKEHMKQHIEKLHALHLFCENSFSEAMNLFFSLNTDLLFVIGLYPDLVPEEYRARVQYPHPIPPLTDDNLKKALEELIHFLLQMRQRLIINRNKQENAVTLSPAVKTNSQKLQIIDTTLLKCYLKTNDSLIVPLLRMRDSRVSVEEGERVLRQAHRYSELVLLLQMRGLHPRALELLLRHSKRKDSPLFGHMHTVKYLQKLGPDHIDLIFEYGGWVLKSHPDHGLEIFTGGCDDPSEVELLPRSRVLSFIKKTQKSLAIPYLEHVIWEWGDSSAVIHNDLVHQYRQIVLLPFRDGEDEEKFIKRRDETREKLLKFLKVSQFYTAATILVYFPHDDLYEERTILLGRLGQHQQALKVYIETLEDIGRAIEYCHSQYSTTGPGSEVYLILLKLLLRSSRSNSPCNTFSQSSSGQRKCNLQHEEFILDILKNYSHCIDVAKVLKTLPDDLNVNLVKSFILKSVIRLSTNRTDSQIVRGLSQAILDQTKTELSTTQMQKIYLSDKNVCAVCCKKFTKSSAFVWYSNGDISHFLCKEQKGSRR